MYAELHCISNFTFLRGASHPKELVQRAVERGYAALAITDECSVAGVVRAHMAAKKTSLKLIIGSEFRLDDGLRMVLLATNRAGYGQLCRLITRARRATKKGSYWLERSDFETGSGLQATGHSKPSCSSPQPPGLQPEASSTAFLTDCLALWLPGDEPEGNEGEWLSNAFPGRCWIAVELLSAGFDRSRLQQLTELGRRLALPLVASGDVHMHVRGRRALQDVLTAIRHGVPLTAAGQYLYPNGERHLRSWQRLAKLYPSELLMATVDIAARCSFSLAELKYEYPEELVPEGETPSSHLRKLAEAGLREHWPDGEPIEVREQVEKELGLIRELRYEAFFLTVHEVVSYARREKILCQGRGSAANSVVCYCLGITAVNPTRKNISLLFGRFLSIERNEPPDIDVDFEHERREEVIQHIYEKYGRHRAALAAALITYRARSAIRDVGKALGLDLFQVDRLARALQWWDGVDVARVRDAGFDPATPLMRCLLRLVIELQGFPRHLSQHVGGFVIARDSLDLLVPVENAAMPERTIIQWDKEDLEELGLLKVDVLALGMLTAIRRSFDLIEGFRGSRPTLDRIPEEDDRVYKMMAMADTIGVFQIESRAQMSMLPRLKPETFYDLVIQVAIVRPGPIQGGMVHPYLRRRAGLEEISYPQPAIKEVLKRTLGVPIFQEQVMQIAMVAAGFTAGEADELRRAMAAWKRKGGLEPFRQKLLDGMRKRGYEEKFALQIFEQIKGFGDYGFPESHAASFALLVYVSAWLKHYEPAAFTAALLNSQPMGFYAPAQLIRDAKEHGVEIRPVDVQVSSWDSILERREDGEPALRLGFRLVKGASEAAIQRLVAARSQAGDFASVQDLMERSALERRELEALAEAGTLACLAGNRHQSLWQVAGAEKPLPLLAGVRIPEGIPLLPKPTEAQNIVADYRSLRFTLGRHPLALLRKRLLTEQVVTAAELKTLSPGRIVRVGGLVIGRQRPGEGNTIFVTLEDETGQVNLIVWARLAERQRKALLAPGLMLASGTLQRQDGVIHVVAEQLVNRSRWLGRLSVASRDFH